MAGSDNRISRNQGTISFAPRYASPPAPSRVIDLAARDLASSNRGARVAARAGTSLPSGPELPDLASRPADPALVRRLGPREALRRGLLPWQRVGACTVVLSARPAEFDDRRSWLESRLGPVRMVPIAEAALQEAIVAGCGEMLVREAEHRAPLEQSCRAWKAGRLRLWLGTLIGTLALLGLLFPAGTLLGLTLVALAALIWGAVLKCLGLRVLLGRRAAAPPPPAPQADVLPTVTLLVPLFREREIAGALLRRLERIDYPRHLLDICLVLEASDPLTRATLERTSLPAGVRHVTVPAGALQTKPRALNYALNFARGTIIGIYDAEDSPAPDQLLRVAARFAAAPSRTACLQGILDFYNPADNLLSRCFTLEYAMWFRALLPALDRLGFAIPLGGTTLFLRRPALEALGGWDAHNVTEDADLGIRLARHGYRTELIDTVTEEEANARPWAWVRQRSRWLKGYAMTYAVHMRHPAALLRDLGAWRFLGVQLLFLGALSQFALAPLLWSFWLLPFGLPHPLEGMLTKPELLAMGGVFLLSEVIGLTLAAVAARAAEKSRLWPWGLALQAYFALGTLAVYKALAEMAWCPFFWDKTSHGLSPSGIPQQGAGVRPSGPPPPRRGAGG